MTTEAMEVDLPQWPTTEEEVAALIAALLERHEVIKNEVHAVASAST